MKYLSSLSVILLYLLHISIDTQAAQLPKASCAGRMKFLLSPQTTMSCCDRTGLLCCQSCVGAYEARAMCQNIATCGKRPDHERRTGCNSTMPISKDGYHCTDECRPFCSTEALCSIAGGGVLSIPLYIMFPNKPIMILAAAAIYLGVDCCICPWNDVAWGNRETIYRCCKSAPQPIEMDRS